MRIPTVTIDRDGTAVVINRSDYRLGVDRLWGAAPVAPPDPIAIPVVDEEAELIDKLAALGIKRDRRSSVETLRKLLAEAT